MLWAGEGRMARHHGNTNCRQLTAAAAILLSSSLTLAADNALSSHTVARNREHVRKTPFPTDALDLRAIPYKILFETYVETEGKRNWEIFQMNADGSNPVNLTQTPDRDEMYPHASPDGTKVCMVVDEGEKRREKVRSVYYMNIDGSGRVKVASNAREPCWGPDSRTIAYLKGEYDRYTTREYATAELLMYDCQTGQHRAHPNTTLQHLYALCWSPDGNWFLAAVHGATEYSDTILAFDANGTRVFDLERWGVRGCRPDFSRDGKRITWGETDWDLCVGDIDFGSGEPRVSNIHKIVECLHSEKVYHVDFSPDGKYIAFSYGPSAGGQQVGGMARGWNICVTDLMGTWVKITSDGNHNKEPDWVPIPSAAP